MGYPFKRNSSGDFIFTLQEDFIFKKADWFSSNDLKVYNGLEIIELASFSDFGDFLSIRGKINSFCGRKFAAWNDDVVWRSDLELRIPAMNPLYKQLSRVSEKITNLYGKRSIWISLSASEWEMIPLDRFHLAMRLLIVELNH